VISLSPEPQRRGVELKLDAYRAMREDLLARLRRRFPPRGAPVVG
jgi:hypothetical protein